MVRIRPGEPLLNCYVSSYGGGWRIDRLAPFAVIVAAIRRTRRLTFVQAVAVRFMPTRGRLSDASSRLLTDQVDERAQPGRNIAAARIVETKTRIFRRPIFQYRQQQASL